jgi:hypothetical protein
MVNFGRKGAGAPWASPSKSAVVDDEFNVHANEMIRVISISDDRNEQNSI